jgi:hypothetical protein
MQTYLSQACPNLKRKPGMHYDSDQWAYDPEGNYTDCLLNRYIYEHCDQDVSLAPIEQSENFNTEQQILQLAPQSCHALLVFAPTACGSPHFTEVLYSPSTKVHFGTRVVSRRLNSLQQPHNIPAPPPTKMASRKILMPTAHKELYPQPHRPNMPKHPNYYPP